MKRLTLIAMVLFAAMMISLCAAGGKKVKVKEGEVEVEGGGCPSEITQLCCCHGCKKKTWQNGRLKWVPINPAIGIHGNKLIIDTTTTVDCRTICSNLAEYADAVEILSPLAENIDPSNFDCNAAANAAVEIDDPSECHPSQGI